MKKRRTGGNNEILYGIHPVVEAMRASRRKIGGVYVSQKRPSRRLAAAADLAGSLQIPVQRVQAERLSAMAGVDTHQGVCAEVGPYPWVALEEMLTTPPGAEEGHFFLLLDQVVDPRNLGAAVRTALGLGVDGVLLPRKRSAMPNAAASKASAGAVEHARIARVTNVADAVNSLKAAGLWIFGLDAAADAAVFDADLSGPVALVIGGEERGIRPLVKAHCDGLLAIPRQGPVLSLNAAAAGAIALYEVFRQRRTDVKSREGR
jgi:23S rRNA (guanosine2251-2'-O)-methyltransferase